MQMASMRSRRRGVPGTIAGALLLVWLPERGLALMLAAVVLGGVVLAALGWQPHPRRRVLATAGAASGLLGTATSIGGPPMALVLSGPENARVRSNMSAFFLVGSLMSLGALAATGNLALLTDPWVMTGRGGLVGGRRG